MPQKACRGSLAAHAAIVLGVAASAIATLSGCAANFSQQVADHPGCVADAGIARWKVDQCLGYGNVHRDAFDICLAKQGVSQHKIEMLDDCVETRSGY